MHLINALDRHCPLVNHFDCNHNRFGGRVHADIDPAYLDTHSYLAGWSAIVDMPEDEITFYIGEFENKGVGNAYECGARDAILAAYGN